MIKNVTKQEYDKIHYWLKKNYGSADKCENKDCNGKSTKYSWSLREDCLYERNRDNFDMLCNSCHTKRDHTEETRQKMRDINLGRKFTMEHRNKIGRALAGRKVPKESVDKLSKSKLEKYGVRVTYRGEERFLREVARETGMYYQTLQRRMERGMTTDEAVDL